MPASIPRQQRSRWSEILVGHQRDFPTGKLLFMPLGISWRKRSMLAGPSETVITTVRDVGREDTVGTWPFVLELCPYLLPYLTTVLNGSRRRPKTTLYTGPRAEWVQRNLLFGNTGCYHHRRLRALPQEVRVGIGLQRQSLQRPYWVCLFRRL